MRQRLSFFLDQQLPHSAILGERLLSISINSAAVERLFSEMGAIHSSVRNRLHEQKVLAICQIHCQLRKEERAHKLREEMGQQERAVAASEARRRIKDSTIVLEDPSDASSTPEPPPVEGSEATMDDPDQDEESSGQLLPSVDEWM